MNDREIIELYKKRDEDAIKQTDVLYGARLRSMVRGMLDSAEDAEECVNDAYLALWNNIPPEKPSSLFAYASKIARNTALTRLRDDRAKKRGRNLNVCLDELADILPSGDDVSDNIEAAELSDLINKFLYSCGEDERGTFVLRYYGFMPVSDIAKKYGFTQSKVKMTLKRCREKLSAYLERNGYKV